MRIAIIGAGIFVKDVYIPNINAHPDRVLLTAILSRSMESITDALLLTKDGGANVLKFAGDEGEHQFFAHAKEFCDSVIIVVPIPLLGKYIERCLRLGLNILSEKPIAMTSVEARRLISLYREVPCKNMWHVAENFRAEPGIRYAGEIVRNHGTAPKAFSLLALRQQSLTSKYAVTKWRAAPEYKGSYVLDGGIHFVALLRAVMEGDVSDISATYEEQSVVEVASCGSLRVGKVLGTFQIRYGKYVDAICRLDVYFSDAVLSIIQIQGVGYEVQMTGTTPKIFEFSGLQAEFKLWLDDLAAGVSSVDLSPEEGLQDLTVAEAFCCSTL
jgi:predicted dehydrogenase